MSLTRFLLVTCAVIATTATVRSQSPAPAESAATVPTGSSPAPLVQLPRPAAVPAFALAPAGSAAPDIKDQSRKIDLSALYYFASQNDLSRVNAEIRLIRSKNPDWQPPDDLFAAANGGADEQPLWDLFGKHDLAGLHAKIEEMKVAQPGWQPSSNLSGKLALADAHDAVVSASDAKQWQRVIEIATGNKMLLTCSDVDALWRTAEALVRTGDTANALAAYRYVLSTCSPPALRLATVQKASLVLPSADALDSLIEMGRPQADGRNEFESVRLDRLRRVVGDATSDPSLPAPAQADLDALATSAKTPAGRQDAQLLGWYFYARTSYPEAQQWFKVALADPTDAKAAEGLVLALRAGGSGEEARKAAFQYADLDDANRKLMVEVVSMSLADPAAHALSDDELARLGKAVDLLKSQDGAQALQVYAAGRHDDAQAKQWNAKSTAWKAEQVDDQKSPEAAAALGWQFFHDHDLPAAEGWFRKSLDWQSNEQAALGLVLSAHLLHHDKDFKARVAQYGASYPSVAKLAAATRARFVPVRSIKLARSCGRNGVCGARQAGNGRAAASGEWDRSADAIVSAYKAGQYEAAVGMLDQRRAGRAEPRGLAVIRGWALYQKGDWDGAKQVFTNLDGGTYSREREEGLRVINSSLTPSRFR